ncbi:ankyrin repeat domain-containing protein [Cardinium endosymbiont of Culicoides punctatus]|uniref:ankyrin repeat domain-containing protein n=1 Tax=Cardinium endosymbiont of Culicoides punctatus TaxID=2304601 RepID=UPI001404CB38|nr:ankyrin repeat domain-containing protein [Cardinium endosymbiont of Culicoides punctatus]
MIVLLYIMSSSKHSCTRQYQLDNGDIIKVAIQKKDENNLLSGKQTPSVVQPNQSNVSKQTISNGNEKVPLLRNIIQTSQFVEVENKEGKIAPNIIGENIFTTNKDTEVKSSSPNVVHETINKTDEDEKVTPLLGNENNFTQLKIDENENTLLHDTTDQNNNENTQPKTDENENTLLHDTTDQNNNENEHSLPLHDAAIEGNLKKVKALLANNENINIQNELGQTLLHLAIQYGHCDIAKVLITNYGANCGKQDNDKNTPLHYVFINNDKKDDGEIAELVKVLLDAQPNIINIQNHLGTTALHLAAEYGLLEVAKILKNYHALLENTDHAGNTPCHYAFYAYYENKNDKNKEIIDLLLDNNNSNVKNKAGITLLHLAAAFGLLEITKRLIEYRVDRHAIDNDHNTALDYAIDSGNQDIINLLSEKEADLNIKNQDVYTSENLLKQQKENKKAKKIVKKITEMFKKIISNPKQKIATTQTTEL